MFRVLVKINTCLVAWLPVCKETALLPTGTEQIRLHILTFETYRKNKLPSSKFWAQAGSVLRSENGHLSFLSLGQEVIKQNQPPCAGHASAHAHDKMSWEQQTSGSDCLNLCRDKDEIY